MPFSWSEWNDNARWTLQLLLKCISNQLRDWMGQLSSPVKLPRPNQSSPFFQFDTKSIQNNTLELAYRPVTNWVLGSSSVHLSISKIQLTIWFSILFSYIPFSWISFYTSSLNFSCITSLIISPRFPLISSISLSS